MMLGNVAPATPEINVGNHCLRDAEYFGDGALGHSYVKKTADFPYVVGRKFGAKLAVILIGSVSNLVSNVFDGKRPSEIVGAVVGFVAIPMSNLMLGRRLRTMEGFADKLMDKATSLRLATDGKFNGRVCPAVMRPRSKNTGLRSLIGANAAKVANLVIGICFNAKPDFGFHGSSLTQAVG